VISRRAVLAMSPGLAMGLTLVGAPRRSDVALALPTLAVTNGDAAVGEAVLTVPLPRGLVGESFVLRDESGEAIATEVLRDRALAFVVRAMAPREVRRFQLEPALDRKDPPPLVARETADGVELTIGGRPVAAYRAQPAPSIVDPVRPGLGRGGYLHPLLSPDGRVVTGDDAPERPEQRGLWSAWAASSFDGRRPDFWHTGAGTGSVEFEGVQRTWSGTIVAGFETRHRVVDRSAHPPATAETDSWRVTLPGLGRTGRRYYALDLESRHEAATAKPLVVAAAAYGSLGFRGPRAWQGATGMAVVTADGRARATASRTRPRWIAIVGLVGGQNAGIALLDHPDNARHPQPVYVDAIQPFVSVAPMQLGPITVARGRDVVLRCRILTFDGFPDRAWLEGLWQAYAHPPRVVIDWTR
jgi:hypothetical protein